MESNILYRVPCLNYEKSYIGQTWRYLHLCLKELDKDVTNCFNSDKRKKQISHQYKFDFSASTTLRKERVVEERLLHEMMEIKLANNSLNKRTLKI